MSRDARINAMLEGLTEPQLKEMRELITSEIARLREKIKQEAEEAKEAEAAGKLAKLEEGE